MWPAGIVVAWCPISRWSVHSRLPAHCKAQHGCQICPHKQAATCRDDLTLQARLPCIGQAEPLT